MTSGDRPIVAEETYLTFAGLGCDLVVRVGSGVDADELCEELLIFLPGCPLHFQHFCGFRETSGP